MKIELFGVRGSLASPMTNNEFQDRLKESLAIALEQGITPSQIDDFIKILPSKLSTIYGGNTTCVSVTSDSGKVYILDTGTGVREIGDRLIKNPEYLGKGEISILFTHTHWDHIQGLPFFKPIYIKGNKLNFISTFKDLKDRLSYQQTERFFPVGFDASASTKSFTCLEHGTALELEPGLILDSLQLCHPGSSTAYRFRSGDRTFIFATDVEFTGITVEDLSPEQDAFFRNADILIIDSQYTLDEAFLKFDWGHTSYSMAINCGIHWNIKKLVLTHHEPSYSDEKLSEIAIEAQEHLQNHAKHTNTQVPELYMAIEGQFFSL